MLVLDTIFYASKENDSFYIKHLELKYNKTVSVGIILQLQFANSLDLYKTSKIVFVFVCLFAFFFAKGNEDTNQAKND